MSEPAERITINGGGNSFSPATSLEGMTGRKAGPALQRSAPEKENKGSDSLELSPEAKEQLRKLQQRDAEVRAHEAAHLAAAGQYAAGGAHFEYQQGPDGRQYAIGGHVDIDTSPVPGDPEATEQKAEQIRRAAKAPGAPSAQDNKVAASAAHMQSQAKAEQQEDEQEEQADTPGMARGLRAYANAAQQGEEPEAAKPSKGSHFALAI